MKSLTFPLIFCILATTSVSFAEAPKQSLFDFKVKDIDGKAYDLSKHKGKVTLIVNTASECGFTPQFKQLEELYEKYGSQGLVILAFPSNDFKQDKGSNDEISSFAKNQYKVTFPLMDKNPVSGDTKQPVFKFLTDSKSGIFLKEIQWNFEKFLIGKDGQVIDRWNTMTKPDSKDIVEKIEAALKAP